MSELITSYPSLHLEQMEQLARNFALRLLPGDTVTLRGEVGAGKTSFARTLIQALCQDPKTEVTSPTFNLMQSYDVTLQGGIKETLWHLDLYRLENSRQATALGLEELWQHIVLLEWPERIPDLLPQTCLDITFIFTLSPQTRTLNVHGNAAWRERLAQLV